MLEENALHGEGLIALGALTSSRPRTIHEIAAFDSSHETKPLIDTVLDGNDAVEQNLRYDKYGRGVFSYRGIYAAHPDGKHIIHLELTYPESATQEERDRLNEAFDYIISNTTL